eukprot:6180535-Pleurochrysis_carterae.AAC.1
MKLVHDASEMSLSSSVVTPAASTSAALLKRSPGYVSTCAQGYHGYVSTCAQGYPGWYLSTCGRVRRLCESVRVCGICSPWSSHE